MKFTLKQEQEIFEVITTGEAELQVFSDFLDALISHPHWKPGSFILVDHSDLNASTLTSADVKTISRYCADRRLPFGNGKCAIVLARDLEFGLARMWHVFMDENPWDMNHQLFRSRVEALEWLQS
ncbi:MAG: hypothetical protein V4507_11960 [Verrucomicrobiota bacterium]